MIALSTSLVIPSTTASVGISHQARNTGLVWSCVGTNLQRRRQA